MYCIVLHIGIYQYWTNSKKDAEVLCLFWMCKTRPNTLRVTVKPLYIGLLRKTAIKNINVPFFRMIQTIRSATEWLFKNINNDINQTFLQIWMYIMTIICHVTIEPCDGVILENLKWRRLYYTQNKLKHNYSHN